MKGGLLARGWGRERFTLVVPFLDKIIVIVINREDFPLSLEESSQNVCFLEQALGFYRKL